MQELIQRKKLGALQLDDQFDHPHEKECNDNPVPDIHENSRGCFWKRVIPRRDTADKSHQAGAEQDYSQDSLQDDRRHAGALVSVCDDAPSQPQKRFEVLPVHYGAFSRTSSHDSFWVASSSAPTFSRKRASRELP